jgi:RimJ/RimL family protein N-acetyltransferase
MRVGERSTVEHPRELRTARLLLRPFAVEDGVGLARVLSDNEAAQFIGGAKSEEEARKSAIRMRDAFVHRGWGTLAVIPIEGGTCIGYCGVRPLACTADVELAFALDRAFWRQGYATEAATAVMDAAFKFLPFTSIVGTVYPDNAASLRVLEKLGLKFEMTVFGFWPQEEALLYRIAKTDWQKIRYG